MITRVDYVVPNLVPELNEDKSNICDFFCADTIASKSFVQNEGGWIQNDVDLIIKQKDAAIAESLFSQLVEVPTSGVPADTPNEEVLLSLKSRYQQSPSELVRYYEKQLEIQDAKRLAANPPKETIEFNDADANVES